MGAQASQCLEVELSRVALYTEGVLGRASLMQFSREVLGVVVVVVDYM